VKVNISAVDAHVTIRGLSWVPIQSLEDACAAMSFAVTRRRTASTAMNDSSSRSHMFSHLRFSGRRVEPARMPDPLPLQAQVEGMPEEVAEAEGDKEASAVEARKAAFAAALADPTMPRILRQRESSLMIVDLAGSERQSQTGSAGATLREAGKINQSLSHLKTVIAHRVEGRAHIPYRACTLTTLARPCLDGGAKVCVIACVSPAVTHLTTTLETLGFASAMHKTRNADGAMGSKALVRHESVADLAPVAEPEPEPEVPAAPVDADEGAIEGTNEAIEESKAHAGVQSELGADLVDAGNADATPRLSNVGDGDAADMLVPEFSVSAPSSHAANQALSSTTPGLVSPRAAQAGVLASSAPPAVTAVPSTMMASILQGTQPMLSLSLTAVEDVEHLLRSLAGAVNNVRAAQTYLRPSVVGRPVPPMPDRIANASTSVPTTTEDSAQDADALKEDIKYQLQVAELQARMAQQEVECQVMRDLNNAHLRALCALVEAGPQVGASASVCMQGAAGGLTGAKRQRDEETSADKGPTHDPSAVPSKRSRTSADGADTHVVNPSASAETEEDADDGFDFGDDSAMFGAGALSRDSLLPAHFLANYETRPGPRASLASYAQKSMMTKASMVNLLNGKPPATCTSSFGMVSRADALREQTMAVEEVMTEVQAEADAALLRFRQDAEQVLMAAIAKGKAESDELIRSATDSLTQEMLTYAAALGRHSGNIAEAGTKAAERLSVVELPLLELLPRLVRTIVAERDQLAAALGEASGQIAQMQAARLAEERSQASASVDMLLRATEHARASSGSAFGSSHRASSGSQVTDSGDADMDKENWGQRENRGSVAVGSSMNVHSMPGSEHRVATDASRLSQASNTRPSLATLSAQASNINPATFTGGACVVTAAVPQKKLSDYIAAWQSTSSLSSGAASTGSTQ
jgi:hypothetical protein